MALSSPELPASGDIAGRRGMGPGGGAGLQPIRPEDAGETGTGRSPPSSVSIGSGPESIMAGASSAATDAHTSPSGAAVLGLAPPGPTRGYVA